MIRISLLGFVLAVFLNSCSEYQMVLKEDDATKKYAMADSLYNVGKYKKALKLMEQIVPVYRGKPQAEKLMYIYANTFYKLEDFYLAGYQFERFESSYPDSDSLEVAAYKSAKSYYELSPRYSLDQKDTDKALERLQSYIDKYPNSNYRTEANGLVLELRRKIEKKDYETALQYLRIEDFKAAIEAFDNFISDHPGASLRKNAFYGRFEAAYKLAINSLPSLVNERLEVAKGHYKSFNKYYEDSELSEEAREIMVDIQERLSSETEEPTSK
ncbi:outer membrane protein assembly factor BamD [Aureitalea sp. L0-47]|uniref:outer membrane protein assembly factor BamD n=1 Tax=Aureitalea sp. L0-47 TaxID=2816962 RepID=UPI0022384F70|nr:outer membrane protein assembly factor BamD [Aureitalea sp. L0-47]MCW5519648.1 outer membrane protein assembly factor BamD [Aureitalea sp. L0-47]